MNKAQVYVIDEGRIIMIGSGDACDIKTDFPCDLKLLGNTLYINAGSVALNGKAIETRIAAIEPGDFFSINTLKITRRGDDGIKCEGCGYSVNLREAPPAIGVMDMDDFPEYKRPPRIVKSIEEREIEIKPPKAKPSQKKGQVLRTLMPPLIMAGLMIGTRVMSGGDIMMIIMSAGMAIAAVFSLTSYFTEKKEAKIEEGKRVAAYEEYLLGKRKELWRAKTTEIEARTYAYPSLSEIETLTGIYSSRIYERTPHDGDFLSVSLGTADISPSYSVKFTDDEFADKEDELLAEAANVADFFRTLQGMPLPADLMKSHLGLVGDTDLIHSELAALIAQLCFLHSYHDMEIVMIADGEDRKQFEWAAWYPHMKLNAINVSGLVTSENHRDIVLGALTQILKERQMKRDDLKKESLYLPHYIIIVLSPKMVVNHSVMEYLKEQGTSLGFSLIWTSPMRESLPENITTVLSLDGKGRGKVLMEDGRFTMTQVKLPDTESLDFSAMSRRLAAIRHNLGMTTQIPESVTFFKLLGIKKPEDLDIPRLWQQGNSAKSLSVPLGLRAPGDVVYLNLHEKVHGPHGLVAGTTGSGKSEILQSYIISLACHFHPYEVGFLLIDYKGGGMANLFEKLPHLLGTITNLDGSESMRALASIKSENARRQRIFTEAGVNNISNYTKAFRKGEVKEPLPHLFIISDEFAELKKEQPDFMAELVSTARMGRSLGVHLILATQKPSGVVDDQIWSNSKFKLCLKVQDASDSNEVLKTPDAAMITQPGRSYLQVGNNETYELFQSAWSGAEYSEHEVEKGYDERVYLLNELRQGVLLNEDVSGGEEKKESRLTQLDAMVNHIADVYEKMSVMPVAKPWLPSLAKNIVSPHVKVPKKALKTTGLSVPIGLVDIPEEQKQEEFVHDFVRDGNLAFFGAPGFGKSVCLMDTAMTLAVKNSPEDLHYFIMDFGNSALIQLKGLPHTADYMTYDQEEKIGKFMRILSEEMDRRKRLFAQESAINFKMYNQIAKEKLPAVIIFVDGFDVVKEIPLELNDFFLRLTRDGNGIGIYNAISASQANAVRYSILNNFKIKIALYLFEKSDLQGIVGRSKYNLPEVKGRALVKLSDACIMQCYLPAPFENDVGYAKEIGTLVTNTAKLYPHSKTQGIPMLPEKVMMEDITREIGMPSYMAPIGLDAERVQRQYIDARESKHMIIGKPATGKSNVLKIILSGVTGKKYMADSMGYELQDFKDAKDHVYLPPGGDIDGFIEGIRSDAETRKQSFDNNGKGIRPKDYYESLVPLSLFIDDVDGFLKTCSGKETVVAEAINLITATGGAVFMTTGVSGVRGYDAVSGVLKDAIKGIVLGNPNDQNAFSNMPRSAKAGIDIGYLAGYGDVIKIKFPLA